VLLAYAKVLGERERRGQLTREREREREGAVAVVNNPLPEGKKESFHLSGR
jgi:hypothetical protein